MKRIILLLFAFLLNSQGLMASTLPLSPQVCTERPIQKNSLLPSLVRLNLPRVQLSDYQKHIANGVAKETLNFNDYYSFNNSGSSKSWIKFVIFKGLSSKEDKILYFRSKESPQEQGYFYHADFLRSVQAHSQLTNEEVDKISLFSQGRQVYFGALLINYDGGQFGSSAKESDGFEIVGTDFITPQEVLSIQSLVKDSIKGDFKKYVNQFKYYPVFNQQDLVRAQIGAFTSLGLEVEFPKIDGDEQIYSTGWGAGKVIILSSQAEMDSALSSGELTRNSIVVLGDQFQPRQMPPVSAIISAAPGSEQSHLGTLSTGLEIPFYFQKEAVSKWQSRSGKFYYVAPRAYENVLEMEISQKSQKKLLEVKEGMRPKPYDLPLTLVSKSQTLIDLKNLSSKDADKVGAKAANLAEMLRLLSATDKKAYEDVLGSALPFSFYVEHLDQDYQLGVSLKQFIEKKLSEIPKDAATFAQAEKSLIDIRKAIMSVPVNSDLIKSLQATLYSLYQKEGVKKVKFRSSSNAEDAPNFNGAGLYSSTGVKINAKDKQGELVVKVKKLDFKGNEVIDGSGKAIKVEMPLGRHIEEQLKRVWASLYSPAAFWARRQMNITNKNLAMGILVNRAFKDEKARGVALVSVSNSFGSQLDPRAIEVVMTGFKGDKYKVVELVSGVIPEKTKVRQSFDGKDYNITQLQTSSIAGGGTTMIMKERKFYENLHKKMSTIYQWWWKNKKTDGKLVLDFEWKLMSIDKPGCNMNDEDPKSDCAKIVLKQVRPLPVPEQRRASETLVVGSLNGEKIYGTYGESRYGMVKLETKFTTGFSFDHFLIADGKNIDLPFKDFFIRWNDGSVEKYDLSDVQPKVSVEPWKVRFDNSATKIFKFEFRLPSAALPSTKFKILFELRRDKAGRMTNNAVATLNNAQVLFEAESSDFIHRKEYPRCEVDFNGKEKFLSKVSWRGTTNGNKVVGSAAKERIATESISNESGKVKLAFEGKTKFGGLDKTMYLSLTKATYKGLTSQEIVNKNSEAMVYAPAHHNFDWEYAADISLFDLEGDGIDTGDMKRNQQTMQELGGRYIVYSSGNQIGGFSTKQQAHVQIWSADGKIKDNKVIDLDHRTRQIKNFFGSP